MLEKHATTINIGTPTIFDGTTTEQADAVVGALCKTMGARDFRLLRHSERVARYAARFATELGLTLGERMTLHNGALLHDIGNIAISDVILNKPSALSEWEFEEVKMHTVIGEQICSSLLSLQPLAPMIRWHHEHLDGSGYPDGLKGDEIPKLVRILSVLDVYDTLRSARSYSGAYDHISACDILKNEVERGWWEGNVVELLYDLKEDERMEQDAGESALGEIT